MKLKFLFVQIVSVAEKIYMRFITLSIFLFSSVFVFAQQTIVKGKITDANSGDPIPFVNVVFKGTGIGSTTDFDGNFTYSKFVAVNYEFNHLSVFKL